MPTGIAQAPFLDFKSFEAEEPAARETELRTIPTVSSPFVSVYESGETENVYEDPAHEAFASIAEQLYDEEFDEALFELYTETRGLHDEHLASGMSDSESERVLSQQFEQLARESESMIASLATEFETRGAEGLTDNEVESFVDNYTPTGHLEPAFENFFGRMLKKIGGAVKAVAGKALQVVKNLGLGFILGKIKLLIMPMLRRVLEWALGKIPAGLRPIARQLAERLGIVKKTLETEANEGESAASGESVGSPVQESAGPNATEMQLEFNAQIAEALLAQDEATLNQEVASIRNSSNTPAVAAFSDLDHAREQFIQELENLKEGESAEPHIQHFLPAVLPVLRVAIAILGRPKLVNFIAQYLAPLVAKLIGPQYAPPLSQAIVNAGLRLISLEMSEQEKSGLAASAVAATVEETIRRVASLPEHILDDREMLEGYMLEAFEQSAAANLPAVLSEAVYRQRPGLLEGGVNAAWILMPLRGRKRYKRCSRVFKVKITPHMAEELESFENTPMSEYLQDQLGLPEGGEVEAEVHLYETLPGTTAADISRGETLTEGLGASDEATFSQLHPLTEEAASALLGKAGLGRNLAFGSDIRNLAVGQRLYHLAIPRGRPLTVLHKSGRHRVRRLTHLNVTLNGVDGRLKVCMFISETRAQRIAVRLRQQTHAGSLAVGFHRLIRRRLPGILHGRHRRRLRIVAAGVPLMSQAILRKLPGIVPRAFIAKVEEWLLHGFAEFLKTQSQKFIAAAEDPADGLTLRFIVEHPQGLKELCQALASGGSDASKIADAVNRGGRPIVRVDVFPGHRCD